MKKLSFGILSDFFWSLVAILLSSGASAASASVTNGIGSICCSFIAKLRCLVVIDLKRGRFTHADAGQMHMYLNYAREHWTHEDENPPVGLILCSQKDEAIARYALDGLPNRILATEYRTVLPDEQLIADEIEKTRKQLEARQKSR